MILRLLALLLVAVPAHAQEKAEPASSTVAPVELEAGVSLVTVTVSGTIELR